MTEVVEFEDAVALCVAYLKAQFALLSESATVASKFRSGRHVKVSDAGGDWQNLVQDAPRVTFDCYDVTEPAAKALHKRTRARVRALEGQTLSGVFIAQVTGAGNPGFFPDPDTNLPRYQFTVELLISGSPI